MHCEFFKATCTHGIDARAVPDVCPIAPVLSQFKIVDMRRDSMFPYEKYLKREAGRLAEIRFQSDCGRLQPDHRGEHD
jgi:hypothetical protein